MPRKPSAETKLRHALSKLKYAMADREAAQQQAAAWRSRALAAEKDAAEWRARFDTLLARDGKVP